jgi:hypothetical protein
MVGLIRGTLYRRDIIRVFAASGIASLENEIKPVIEAIP